MMGNVANDGADYRRYLVYAVRPRRDDIAVIVVDPFASYDADALRTHGIGIEHAHRRLGDGDAAAEKVFIVRSAEIGIVEKTAIGPYPQQGCRY